MWQLMLRICVRWPAPVMPFGFLIRQSRKPHTLGASSKVAGNLIQLLHESEWAVNPRAQDTTVTAALVGL